MAITIQPAFDALPAYRPVKFQATFTVPDPVIVENAVVTILNFGVAIGPPIRYKATRSEPSVFPGATAFIFEIDIQKYIQDILGPNKDLTSTFPPASTIGSIENEEMFGLFSISVTYEVISLATGLLEPTFGIVDVSNQFYVYSIARQSTAPFFEEMLLTDYVGSPILNPSSFLTKSSRTLTVCEDDQAFLSIVQPNIFVPLNGFRIELFDANGASLDFGLGETGNPAFSNMQTMNTGFNSLAAQTYVDGAPNWANPLIASYTISFGYLFLVGGPAYVFFNQTELFTYEIKGKCCGLRELRLHWMNLLGGSDSYTFKSQKDLILSTTSDRSQAALPWTIGSLTPHNASDVGNFKIKSEGSTAFQLTSQFLTNTEATWLSELLMSPKVYAELNGELIPVIIEDTQQSISRDQGKIKFEVIATLANEFIIQRI